MEKEEPGSLQTSGTLFGKKTGRQQIDSRRQHGRANVGEVYTSSETDNTSAHFLPLSSVSFSETTVTTSTKDQHHLKQTDSEGH